MFENKFRKKFRGGILKMKYMKKTNEKGITLIALVVSIIILLILAGTGINALAGQNRNFKKNF